MRIILLGGTGYLGSKILQKLCEQQNDILCITRTPEKYRNLKNIIYCGHSDLEEAVMNFKPVLFINTACCYQKAGTLEQDIMEANFVVPARVLQLSIASGIERVITVGTSLPDDFNMYSFSKRLFSDLGKWYSESGKVQFVNIELENFYGEDQPLNNFISNITHKMINNEDIPLTKGTQKRDFIYIDDVVNAICGLVTRKWRERYAEIPVGTGEAPTIMEVVEYLCQITGSHSKLLFGAVPMRENEPDTMADKVQMRTWGISPKYRWKQGMERMVMALNNNE